MRPVPERLTGEQQTTAVRMALYGATAREIAEAIGVNFSVGNYYVTNYRAKLQSATVDDRVLARAMTVEGLDRAYKWLDLASQATETIVIAGTAVEVPRPDIDGAAKILGQINAMLDRIGEMGQAIGQPGAARINADSKRDEQAREQEFAINHPDRIPGLGFNGPAIGQMTVIQMPKTAQVMEAERLRLAAAHPGPDEAIIEGDCESEYDQVS